MQNYPINVHHRRIPPHIGDVVTPVSLYLTLRDLYPNTILLESSDYHGNNNSTSFICFDPMADFLDRKSTRLNSSHVRISYAVFCLKKKKKQVYTQCITL